MFVFLLILLFKFVLEYPRTFDKHNSFKCEMSNYLIAGEPFIFSMAEIIS